MDMFEANARNRPKVVLQQQKAARRRYTESLPKCACGNVAQKGKGECSRCENERREVEWEDAVDEQAATKLREVLQEAIGEVPGAEVFDALGDFIDRKLRRR